MTEPAGPPGFDLLDDDGFPGLIGPFFQQDAARPEDRVFGFRAAARHLNRGGVVHGGMLIAFADQSLGRTVHDTARSRCSTISLQTNFAAPGRDGDWIACTGRITRVTRSVVFISGRVFTEERTLLDVMGVWKLLG